MNENFIDDKPYDSAFKTVMYECQSKGDSTMIVRMYRYGARTAFEQRYEKDGDITDFEKREVLNLLKSVSDARSRKYENITKEVDYIMGGHLLKFPDTEALKESKNEGRIEGRIEGRVEERIDTLREFGMSDSKIIEDIKKKFGLSDEQVRKYLTGGDGLSDIKEA